jgi:hypothetical protein
VKYNAGVILWCMSWRVSLSPQAETWVRRLAITDPLASSWITAAIDHLQDGPPSTRRVRVPPEDGCLARQRLLRAIGVRRTRKVRIWYGARSHQRVIHVVQGKLTGSSADDSCVIRYERLPWTTASNRTMRTLLRLAVNVLPSRHRARYAEEFRAEVHELVAAGYGRSTVILYALRMASRSLMLRRAMIESSKTASALSEDQ